MLNNELVRGSRSDGYDCKFCNRAFADRQSALDHAIFLHDVEKTACMVICRDCDFERHYIEDCTTTTPFSARGDARQKANRAKAGHKSHHRHHFTTVVKSVDRIPE